MAIVNTRPAESAAVAAALALLVTRLLGVDDVETVTALGIVIGFVPAVVTWLVVQFRGGTSDPGDLG